MCDWKNLVVLLLCHTKVLVIESKLNNVLPGTNEMTVAENGFYCSVSFEDYQISFFLALSLSFLLSELYCVFVLSLQLCSLLVRARTHVHTHFTEQC